MIVHVLANHPRNGQPKAAPLVGLCGKEIVGLYVRRADRSSRTVCHECKAALARDGEAHRRDESATLARNAARLSTDSNSSGSKSTAEKSTP